MKHSYTWTLILQMVNICMEAYDTLMRSTGQYKGSCSMLVDNNNFGNGNTILVFDLTARGECNSEQFTVRKLENVGINLKYSNALTEKTT